jgi:hypothetical protein
MLTKGKFFWKKTWYSFCSRHREYDETCNICTSGSWSNNWIHSIGNVIYKNCPTLWIWWLNRK